MFSEGSVCSTAKNRIAVLHVAVLALIIGAFLSTNGRGQNAPRVVVGPNIIVSRNYDAACLENFAASHPTDSNILQVAAICERMTDRSQYPQQAIVNFVSSDGGQTWRTVEYPAEAAAMGDPMTGFTADGGMLMLSIGYNTPKYPQGRLVMFGSGDSGKGWNELASIEDDAIDREILAVDHSNTASAGNVYVQGLINSSRLGGSPTYGLVFYTSTDNGQTFTRRVVIANGKSLDPAGEVAMNSTSLGIFSDGEIFAPFHVWWKDPKRSGEDMARGKAYRAYFAVSKDQGRTFGHPKAITTKEGSTIFVNAEMPYFAIDNSAGKYKDRVYMMWAEGDEKAGKVWITYSIDRGQTWIKPKPIDNGMASTTRCSRPAMAVNKGGVVAVTWFGTNGAAVNRKVSLSTDGGVTFTPPVNVTTQPSSGFARAVFGSGGFPPGPNMTQQQFGLGAIQAADHYTGLFADAAGIFHAFWWDNRLGTAHQIYTATIKVDETGKASPTLLLDADVTKQIQVYADPIVRIGGEIVDIPIRLRNMSTQTIFGPLKVEVVAASGFLDRSPLDILNGRPKMPGMMSMTDREENEKDIATNLNRPPLSILNSENRATAVGAIIDFSKEAGTLNALAPGAISGAVSVRISLPADTLLNSTYKVRITGRVPVTKRTP